MVEDSSRTDVPQSMRLPKTLKYLAFHKIDFDNMGFLLDLTQLTSLELNNLNYVSNDMLTYVSKNCLGLQSFKIGCKCSFKFFILSFFYYRYNFKINN